MGKKKQKVRWVCIEESGRNQRVPEEEDVCSVGRMSLSPEQLSHPAPPHSHHPHPAHRIYHLEKSCCTNVNTGPNSGNSTYARRPVAPRFERKAAAAEVVYDSRHYRGRELSGESGEELPLGFTKIRSKNLDVLFKRDYYSTKGMNSEANTHSETSSLTQKEDEKEEDIEEELDEEEQEEELEEVYEEEEDISSSNNNKKKESTPKLTSKLNGSSSPFYPSSSPSYVMTSMNPYMTGRPNLFLYSPSSNTMIPCEEVVVPGMYSGSPSSPQNVYLAAFPMESGSNPYMMHHPSYVAPPPPPYYQPQQPVYSDAEPSSAESTVPHSPPDLSAYNPAYWGEVHSHRGGYYPHPSYHQYQANQVYPQSSPQQTPEEVPEVIELSVPDKKEETDNNSIDNRRVPGLPPQPKKSQKKKRKKKSKQPTELVHRNSTSSEDGQSIHHIKDEVPSHVEESKSDQVSNEESVKEFEPSAASSPSAIIEEEEEIAKSQEEDQIVENISGNYLQVIEPTSSPSSPAEENVIELEVKSQVIETPPASVIQESIIESQCSPPEAEEDVPPPQEEVEEKISQVVLDEKVDEIEKLSMEDVEEKVDVIVVETDKTPRMLYSSVVSQSMPQPPPKSPVHNITSKKSLNEASLPLPKVKLPISLSMENLRPTEKVEKKESEWLESSSRKKIKRHRQSKKSKSSKYSSSVSSSMIRSISLDTTSKKEVIIVNPPKETKIEDIPATTCSLDVLPSCFKTEESSDISSTTPTTPQEPEVPIDTQPVESPSSQVEDKSYELAEEKVPSNSVVSKKSVVKRKKKRGNAGGIAGDSSTKSSNSGESSSKKQVLICDGDIDVSSSFSSFKRVSDFGNLRIHSQPFNKGSLDTVFISDVGIGIRNGPIMSGRPLRIGKYSPPDRAQEILSMKASLSTEDSTNENAQYNVPLD
uniref:Uncharacterized protein n=1 Tax=Lepeophtheirus salmonis TaxID=72036 RepID=A0A0K2TQB6_LEPSM